MVLEEAPNEKTEDTAMATNGVNGVINPAQATTRAARRYSRLLSSVALRLAIAFLISWLIILAFFVSGVVSH